MINSIQQLPSQGNLKRSFINGCFWGLAYALTSYLLLNHYVGVVGENPIWIPSGICLGALIILGARYWPYLFMGALLGELGVIHPYYPFSMAIVVSAVSVLGALIALWVLKGFTKFNPNFDSLADYLRLLCASLIGASLGAFVNLNLLKFAGYISPENFSSVLGKWFVGDFFGMAFISPLALILSRGWQFKWNQRKTFYFVLVIALTAFLGQAIFFGWFKDFIDLTGRGNLLFFVITLVALYFGRQGSTLVFGIILIQALISSLDNEGFIGKDMKTQPASMPMWVYLGVICVFSLFISFFLEANKRRNLDLVKSRNELKRSEELYRGIVATTPALMATYDLKTEVTDFVNPYFTKVLGYLASDFKEPNSWWPLAYPDPIYRQEVQDEWNRRAEISAKTGVAFESYVTRTACKDGSTRLISWGSYLVGDRMFIYGVDVTAQSTLEETLQVSSAVYRAIGDAIVIFDVKGNILQANEAFCRLSGCEANALTDKTFSELLVKKSGARSYSDIYTSLEAIGRWEGQAWVAAKSGSEILKFLSIYSNFDSQGMPLQRVALISEVTDQRKARELINQQANFDSLTGLPNRRLMFDRLDQLIKQAARYNKKIAVIYLDIDNFKDVNDSRGHDFGDQLLKGIASRLRAEVRQTDTVARIGGDEFVILLGDLERPEVADGIVRQISKKLSDPLEIDHHMIYVTASLGIALFPNDGADGKSLLLGADQAMYSAKAMGRNGFQYFTQTLQVNASYRTNLIAELREALAKNQFEMFYQPIVDLKTSKIAHAEALLRWRRSNGEIVSPASFIQIAEESGAIVDIGEWVWNESIQFFAGLQCGDQFSLAINVAASQFNANQHSAVKWLEVLKANNVSPQSIVLEITERMMLNQSQRVTRKIAMFQEAGCKFSVDDFGTGYSSLASLKNFNFDYIKIDADFIKSLEANDQNTSLVNAMISMSKGLGLQSIAEGVETHEQVEILRNMGCTYAQGYLFGKPLSSDAFKALIKQCNLDS